MLITVNNDPSAAQLRFPAAPGTYMGVLHGDRISTGEDWFTCTLPGNSGEIWVPEQAAPEGIEPLPEISPAVSTVDGPEPAPAAPELPPVPRDRPYEEMTVEELQAGILEKMAANGPVTDRMRQDVLENIWHDSLVNWIRSFSR